jgi:hypothetical protein
VIPLIHAPFVHLFHIVSWHTALMVVAALPDLDQLDVEALKMLVVQERERRLDAHAALAAKHLELNSRIEQIEHLKRSSRSTAA